MGADNNPCLIGVNNDPCLISVDNNPCLIGADNDPCSRRGSGEGRRVFKEASLRELPSSLLMRLRGAIVELIKRGCIVRTLIQSLPFFSSHPFCRSQKSGKQLITLEDLNVIREGYSILSNIVLSVPVAHETTWDNRPRYLCLNEYMLGVGVRIPFEFGVVEALWAFNVPPACIVSYSWKVIRTMAWYCERRGCSADRYLWRELLTRRSSQGYVEFLARRDVKGIDNPLDCMLGWESRFFFARLTSERDIWGVPEQWEGPLSDPIPRSHLSLSASQWWALMYFRGTTLRLHSSRKEFFHWCESACFAVAKEGELRALKRVRSSEEEHNLADSDSSAKEAPGSSSSGQLTPTTELEGMTLLSVVAQLKEELEASRAKMLRGDVARSSAMVEYLRSDAYHRRVEFEQAHHSRSGYVRALSDVASLYLEIDLSSLYRSP
ncbi:hypothetical protein ACLOJK_034423 [Asimina triloba]